MKTIQLNLGVGHWGFIFLFFLSFSSCSFLNELTTEPTGSTTTTTSTKSPSTVDDASLALRSSIVDFAKKQKGVKYKYAGNSPREGFDCSGLTHYVMKEFDISLSRTSRSQAKEGKKVDISKSKAGDLIFFKRSKTGPVFHVALVISNNRQGLKVIHSTSRGVVIEDISKNSYWKPKIYSARQVI